MKLSTLWQKNSIKQSKSTNDKKLYEFADEIDVEFVILNRDSKELAKKFKSGNDYIDKFIRQNACKDKETVTYAAIDKEKQLIIAIMTLVASGIYFLHKPPSVRPNIVMPAVEIKNFALDERYQKTPLSATCDTTLSRMIFSKYMRDILELSKNTIGIKKIVLYSVDKAITFYQRFGFKQFKSYMARSDERAIKNCTPMYFSLF